MLGIVEIEMSPAPVEVPHDMPAAVAPAPANQLPPIDGHRNVGPSTFALPNQVPSRQGDQQDSVPDVNHSEDAP